MTPHTPEKLSTKIDRSPFVIMGTRCHPEILRTRTKRTRTKKTTAPTNRRVMREPDED